MFTFPKDIHLIWFGAFSTRHIAQLQKWRETNPEYQLHVWHASTTLGDPAAADNQSLLIFCATQGVQLHDIADVGFDKFTNMDLVREELLYKRYVAASDILRISIMFHCAGIYRDFDCAAETLPSVLTAEIPFLFAFSKIPDRAAPHLLGATHTNLEWFKCLTQIQRLSYQELHRYETQVSQSLWWRRIDYPALQYAATTTLTGCVSDRMLAALSLEDRMLIAKKTTAIRELFLDTGPVDDHYRSCGGYMFFEQPSIQIMMRFLNGQWDESQTTPPIDVQHKEYAVQLVKEIGRDALLTPDPHHSASPKAAQ